MGSQNIVSDLAPAQDKASIQNIVCERLAIWFGYQRLVTGKGRELR